MFVITMVVVLIIVLIMVAVAVLISVTVYQNITGELVKAEQVKGERALLLLSKVLSKVLDKQLLLLIRRQLLIQVKVQVRGIQRVHLKLHRQL